MSDTLREIQEQVYREEHRVREARRLDARYVILKHAQRKNWTPEDVEMVLGSLGIPEGEAQ